MQPNPHKPTIRAAKYYSDVFGEWLFAGGWKLYLPGEKPKRFATWRDAMRAVDFHYRWQAFQREVDRESSVEVAA